MLSLADGFVDDNGFVSSKLFSIADPILVVRDVDPKVSLSIDDGRDVASEGLGDKMDFFRAFSTCRERRVFCDRSDAGPPSAGAAAIG